MEAFHEVFDFTNSTNVPPPFPYFQNEDLTVYTKQKLNEYLGILLSADPIFFSLTRPTTLQATQSTANTPTQVAKTFIPI